MGNITYFGVGSALLVLDRMAMLEPRYVGRVTERLPRFLYIHFYNMRTFPKEEYNKPKILWNKKII